MQQVDHSKVKQDVIQKLSILSPSYKHQSILFCADASMNISLLYGGYFPIACFNLRDQILPPGTFANNLIVKLTKLTSADDCSQLVCLGQVLLPAGMGDYQ